MAMTEIHVPDIGDFDEVTVIELLVKPGDPVAAEQSLITVESDKASMEIPSSQAGIVRQIAVKLGDKVKQGSLVLVLESAAAVASTPPVAQGLAGPASLEYPPGSQSVYSDLGYILLGFGLEDAGGAAFETQSMKALAITSIAKLARVSSINGINGRPAQVKSRTKLRKGLPKMYGAC